MINHGHIFVNKHKVSIPSYRVKVGNVISLKANSTLKKRVEAAIPTAKDRRERYLTWLVVDDVQFEVKVMKLPTAADLPQDFNVKLVVEFYNR